MVVTTIVNELQPPAERGAPPLAERELTATGIPQRGTSNAQQTVRFDGSNYIRLYRLHHQDSLLHVRGAVPWPCWGIPVEGRFRSSQGDTRLSADECNSWMIAVTTTGSVRMAAAGFGMT